MTKKVTLLILLLALVEAEKLRNIDYLCVGYDIYQANPHANHVDPGLKTQKIFNLTYLSGEQSADGLWNVPDSVTLLKTDACSLHFNSKELSSMESYQQSLEVEVTVKGGYADVASFKASTDYKATEKKITTTSDKFWYSEAVCDLYRAKSSVYNPPRLHSGFIFALKSLPTSYIENDYFDFLSEFGTHAVTEINMGARFGLISSIHEKSYEELKSQNISVSLAASFSAFGYSGGIDTRNSDEKELAKKYDTSITSKEMVSIGAKPVGDATKWALQTITAPMPLRYTLMPLSEIVTSLYVRESIDTDHLTTLRSNIQNAAKKYCNNYLKPRNMIADCNAPAPALKPKPKPETIVKPQIRRYCVPCYSCGGNWKYEVPKNSVTLQGVNLGHECKKNFRMLMGGGCLTRACCNKP